MNAEQDTSMPELTFTVTGVRAVRWAAIPTLDFQLDIHRLDGGSVRSIMLVTTIRVAPARRRYQQRERDLLVEVFGPPGDWAKTLRPLPWTRTTTVVSPFTGTTTVSLPVACTQDVELAVTKYFHAVRTGEVPLDFLFSGTVFDVGPDGGLRTSQIAWSSDATFALPSERWHELVTGSAWLRTSQESFERLYSYKSQHALRNWDDTLASLLTAAERDSGTART